MSDEPSSTQVRAGSKRFSLTFVCSKPEMSMPHAREIESEGFASMPHTREIESEDFSMSLAFSHFHPQTAEAHEPNTQTAEAHEPNKSARVGVKCLAPHALWTGQGCARPPLNYQGAVHTGPALLVRTPSRVSPRHMRTS